MTQIKDLPNLFDPKAPKLEVVNPEDFRPEIFGSVLGLEKLNKYLLDIVGTYKTQHTVLDQETGEAVIKTKEHQLMKVEPTSDEDELYNRINIFKFFRKHKHREFVDLDAYRGWYPAYPDYNHSFYSKYLREHIDISEYDKLKMLNHQLQQVGASDSERLELFREQLSRIDEMLVLEREIGEHIHDVASKSGEYIGIVNVHIKAEEGDGRYEPSGINRKISCYDNAGVGITHISKHFTVKEWQMPKFLKKILPTAVSTSIEYKKNREITQQFYDDKLITDINSKRINNYIEGTIARLLDHNNGERMFRKKRISDEEVQEGMFPNPLIADRLPAHERSFIYQDGSGERTLYDMAATNKAITFSVMYHIEPDKVTLKFNGFPMETIREQRNFLNEHREKFGDTVAAKFKESKSAIMAMSHNYFDELEMKIIGLFRSEGAERFCFVDKETRLSGDVFSQYMPKLTEYEPVAERLKKINEWKNYIEVNLRLFNGYSIIMHHFEEYFQKYKLSLPTLVRDGKKTFTFKNLLPLHLVNETNSSTGRQHSFKSLKPITSLDSFGANLVVLTGQNAGGKSVALETIVNTTWLAHSGVPIFGDSFEFNIRQAIGICFLSRGKGSTMQLQSQKITNILRAFRDIEHPDKCLAIIDELGTGTTQENSMYDPAGGYGFGIKILTACMAYDTIISTQITSLAEFAEENYDSISYMFDNQHNISIGIGKPDLNKLIKDTGLDEFI